MADDPTLKDMVLDSLAWAETRADPAQAPPWLGGMSAEDQALVTGEVRNLVDAAEGAVQRAYGTGDGQD